jgi:hypothetical protein
MMGNPEGKEREKGTEEYLKRIQHLRISSNVKSKSRQLREHQAYMPENYIQANHSQSTENQRQIKKS